MLARLSRAYDAFKGAPEPPTPPSPSGQLPHAFAVETRSFAQSFIAALADSPNFSDEILARAFSVGVVAWACASKQARFVRQLPVQVVDGDGNELKASPAQQLLDNSFETMFRVEMSLRIWGKALLLKRRNNRGFPSALDWINPLQVQPVYDYQTQHITGWKLAGARDIIPPRDMIAMYNFNPLSASNGISSLEMALTNVKAERDQRQWISAYFQNNAIPPVIIQTESQDAAKKLYEELKKSHKGTANAHRTFVTWGQNMTAQQLNVKPSELAMPELDKMTARDTCVAFDINPVLVGLSQAADALSAQGTYESIERDHIENVVTPQAQWICSQLNKHWLIPDFPGFTYRLQPDMSAVVASTLGTSDRSTTARANVDSGLWRLNEAREYTGKPPVSIDLTPLQAQAAYNDNVLEFNVYRLALGLDPIPDMDNLFKKDVTPEAAAGSGFPFGLSETQPLIISSPQAPLLSSGGKDAALLEKQLDELRKWRKVVVSADDPTATFEVYILPEHVAGWVREQLGAWWNPELVFDAARDWLREDSEPQPFGATPEDALDYWQHFDDLKADLGAAWVEYMAGRRDAVVKAVVDNQTPKVSLTAILREGHADLFAAWICTPEEPGVLSQLIAAGMAAGNESLNKEIDTSPEARSKLPGIRNVLQVDWDILNKEAVEFAKAHALAITYKIDETTEKRIRDAIVKWLESKGTVAELQATLDTLLPKGDKVPKEIKKRRAKIAQTESIIAYNEGAFKRWEKAGIQKSTWQTVRDGFVCKVCRRLHGMVANFRDGWTVGGKTYRASAHPGCRCFRRPVVDRVAIDTLVELLAGVAA